MGADDDYPGPEDWDDEPVPEKNEIIPEVESITLSPQEHQQLKDLINGEQTTRIKGHDRRYLVVGAGGESGAATRRMTVYDRLDARTNPPAVAFRLEDIGLTPEEIRIWTRAFDILCGMATHIVAVLEDFAGGYVWELGLMFSPDYRGKAWILKRRYEDATVEREKYDNGMAISHVKLLLTSDRCHEWTDIGELRDAITEIP